MRGKVTIFYDSECKLRDREISYYKRLDKFHKLHFYPLIEANDSLQALGVNRIQALQKLHGLSNSGQLHIGVDAFMIMWQALPKWWVLARVLKLPLLKRIAVFIYEKFAAWRYSKLAHCEHHDMCQK